MAQEMTCRLVTPEGVLFEGPFKSLVVPAHDGLMGVLPGHAPFVGKLGIGPMKVEGAGKVLRFGVHGGFLQVTPGRVDVVVDKADLPEKLDLDLCRKDLDGHRGPHRRDYTGHEEHLRDRKIAAMRVKLAEDVGGD